MFLEPQSTRSINSNRITRYFGNLLSVRWAGGLVPFLITRNKDPYQFFSNSYLKGTPQAELPFEELFVIIETRLKIEKKDHN